MAWMKWEACIRVSWVPVSSQAMPGPSFSKGKQNRIAVAGIPGAGFLTCASRKRGFLLAVIEKLV
jgi:hypothetical protein